MKKEELFFFKKYIFLLKLLYFEERFLFFGIINVENVLKTGWLNSDLKVFFRNRRIGENFFG